MRLQPARLCMTRSNSRAAGDTLIVWKLDRLARSMKQLIETVETLRVKGYRVAQPDRSPRHDDRAGAAGFSHVRGAGGVRAQLDPGAHPSGPRRRSARGPHRRSSAKTYGRRYRGCQGDAGQPRYWCHPNRTPSRCLSGDALSVHPRCTNCEYPWSLKRRFTIRASIRSRPKRPPSSFPS